MSRRLLLLVVSAATVVLSVTSPALASKPVQPVEHVELDRYAGSWLQLAAIPQWFSFACVRDTTATYTAQADGTIGVTNRCQTGFGVPLALHGAARVTDLSSNAQLQVTFLRVGDEWVYVGGTNYVIIGLAADYSWAVTTDPSRMSAFVLSRTPTLRRATQRRIKHILRANGIAPCRLQVTPVTGGATRSRPAC